MEKIGQTFEFSDVQFEKIADLAHKSFALKLDLTKKSMVYRRLVPRLREKSVADFGQYVDLLNTSEEERLSLLSSLTTNLTHFFREKHHFDMLSKDWMPALIDKAKSGGRVRMWSSACSSGEEPYSLSMLVHDLVPEVASLNWNILATDIDPVILRTARQAEYDAEKMNGISPAQKDRFFTLENASENIHRVKREIRNLVSFGQLNLPAEWPFQGKFDVIFCRNVVIYFDDETQERLLLRMVERLHPGGLLCLGHSERVRGPATELLESLGKTAYRKKG